MHHPKKNRGRYRDINLNLFLDSNTNKTGKKGAVHYFLDSPLIVLPRFTMPSSVLLLSFYSGG